MNAPSLVILLLTLTPLAAQQTWTPEELDTRARPFADGDLPAQWQALSEIVKARADALPALLVRLGGSHQEQQLEIVRLLDQLADERWVRREQAERALIEMGPRVRPLAAWRVENGKTLEERLRSQRILDRLQNDPKANERAEAELRVLRGLLWVAAHLDPEPRLANVVRVAADHPDPRVAEAALRALGSLGDDEDVPRLHTLARDPRSPSRAVALGALPRLRGGKAKAAVEALVREPGLNADERVALVRALAERGDAADTLAALAGGADPLVAAAARASGEDGAAGGEVRVEVRGGGQVRGRFLGFRGDSLLLASGELERGMLPVALITRVLGVPPVPATTPARIYLRAGTRVRGTVDAMDATSLRFTSPRFGPLQVARGHVLGLGLGAGLERAPIAPGATDQVRGADGAWQPGAVVGVTGNRIAFQADGATTPAELALDTLQGVVLARPKQNEATFACARLETRDDDRLIGHVARADAQGITLVSADLGPVRVAIADLAALDLRCHSGAEAGLTMIADYSAQAVIEIDDQNRQVFRLDGVVGVWDAQPLDNGNLLVVEFAMSQVKEVSRDGKVVWSYGKLKQPYRAQRLPNGNTLIADTFNSRVIEVDRAGEVVWKFEGKIRPFCARRLPDGNTLIGDVISDRVLEVNAAGNMVWEVRNKPNVHEAERLPNGNTLITLRQLNQVQEVDREGKVVWQLSHLSSPSDAVRLTSGNTLVAEVGWVREFDPSGKEVWRHKVNWAVGVARY
ncbi:MAG: hypothetical protein IT458_00200 [Planctomycetes bacterium]|nr:hypothetical protein [Planctomycetota bacterium]